MRHLRRTLLVLVPLAGVVAWVGLTLQAQRYERHRANYSLIDDGLYMGGALTAPPPGIDAVLNLCEKEDPYCAAVHDWEPIPDSAPAPSLDWLRQRVAWVAARRQAGLTVYVHCYGGVSRAGLVVTAYEMAQNRWGRDRALAFVRSKRPITRPNPAFMELLLAWEHALPEQNAGGQQGKGGTP